MTATTAATATEMMAAKVSQGQPSGPGTRHDIGTEGAVKSGFGASRLRRERFGGTPMTPEVTGSATGPSPVPPRSSYMIRSSGENGQGVFPSTGRTGGVSGCPRGGPSPGSSAGSRGRCWRWSSSCSRFRCSARSPGRPHRRPAPGACAGPRCSRWSGACDRCGVGSRPRCSAGSCPRRPARCRTRAWDCRFPIDDLRLLPVCSASPANRRPLAAHSVMGGGVRSCMLTFWRSGDLPFLCSA